MKTLVGSSALKKHFNDFYRPVDDIDYFSENDIEGADVFYHPDLEKWSWGAIATPDELYTIKVSHSFWELRNRSWSKHLKDIEFMQKKQSFFIVELHEILYEIWEDIHGAKSREYSLHGAPRFSEIMSKKKDITQDKARFDSLSQDERIKLVRDMYLDSSIDERNDALQKVVTGFGNSWFPLFVVLNWSELSI